MTRVMVAIDGTELDDVLVQAAHGLFGDDAEYWAINVQPEIPPVASQVQPALVGAPAVVPGAFGTPYLFHVPDPYRPETTASIDADARSRAANVAEAALVDHDVESGVAIGASGDDPADVIVRQAEAHDVDVVVVGSHERGWLSRLITPSVSEHVLQNVPTPVLVVTTGHADSVD
jgi:nucleotide-binding universal stress UspA family protein